LPRLLYFLLAAYLALCCMYSLATPPFEASDELHHYPVVHEIATGRGLPVQELGVKTAWAQEGSQPPAYYLISAALTFWIDTSDFESVHVLNPFAQTGIPGTPQNANDTRAPAEVLAEPWGGTFLAVYVLRGFSILLGLGTVVGAYLLAATILPERKLIPLLAAGLVAFNPMFLFISASVNNDNLVWLEASLTLWLCMQMVLGPSRFMPTEFGERGWHGPLLAVVLGLAALTKISGLILLPIAGLALLVQALRTKQWRRFFVNGLLIGVAVIVIAGWWYVRNLNLYGELLGINRMVAIAGPRTVGLGEVLGEWRSFLYSFWGLFGAFSILAPSWVYAVFNGLALIGLAGLAWRVVRGPRPTRWQVAAQGLLALFITLTFVGVVRWTMMTQASQGRLMFTTLGALMFYMAVGLSVWIPERFMKVVVTGLVGGLGLMALATVATAIAPAYVPPRAVVESQLPAELKPVRAMIAPGVELVGYQIEEGQRYMVGEDVAVTLYWQAQALINTDYNLFLHLLARDQLLVGHIDSWPGGGLRPTSFWKVGEIYPDRYVIHIDSSDTAEALTPSTLRLDIAMWQEDSNKPFPIQSLTGEALPSVTVAAGLLEPEVWATPKPEHEEGSTFEGGFTLAGYDAPREIERG